MGFDSAVKKALVDSARVCTARRYQTRAPIKASASASHRVRTTVLCDLNLYIYRVFSSPTVRTPAQLAQTFISVVAGHNRCLPGLFSDVAAVVFSADKYQFPLPEKLETSKNRDANYDPFEWEAGRDIGVDDELPSETGALRNHDFMDSLWHAVGRVVVTPEFFGSLPDDMMFVWDLPHACIVTTGHACRTFPRANDCREADLALIWWLRLLTPLGDTGHAAAALVEFVRKHARDTRPCILSYDSDMLALLLMHAKWLYDEAVRQCSEFVYPVRKPTPPSDAPSADDMPGQQPLPVPFSYFCRCVAAQPTCPVVASVFDAKRPFVFDAFQLLSDVDADVSACFAIDDVSAMVALLCARGNDFAHAVPGIKEVKLVELILNDMADARQIVCAATDGCAMVSATHACQCLGAPAMRTRGHAEIDLHKLFDWVERMQFVLWYWYHLERPPHVRRPVPLVSEWDA